MEAFMAQLTIVPSMAFDAICFFEQRLVKKRDWFHKDQCVFIDKVNDLAGDKLNEFDGYLGMSVVFVSGYHGLRRRKRFRKLFT
jgi:uncharacterized protein YrrD